MKIDLCTVGPFQENTYLVVDDVAKRAVLIDPGEEPRYLVDMVHKSGARLEAIWLTHAHLDHIGGIRGVREEWPVPVHMHPLDGPIFERVELAAAMYGVTVDKPDYPDFELTDGQRLTLGSLQFDVLHVPGHSPGHVVFVGEGVMLGGDLLFAGSIGRTDLPGCDPYAMEHSLERVATLDPGLLVYPGHGPTTTIGRECDTNPFLSGVARPLKR